MNIECLESLLTPKFSTKGSIYRQQEEQTYMFFVDVLDECYGNKIFISLIANYMSLFLISIFYYYKWWSRVYT